MSSSMEEALAKVMDLPPFLDAEGFTEWWLNQVEPREREWYARHVVAERCECGAAHCRGWKMNYVAES